MRSKVRIWVIANAATMLAAAAVAALLPGASLVLPLAGLLSLGVLISFARPPSAADALSALRAIGGAGAFAMAWRGLYGGFPYIAVLIAAEITDFFDGRVARKKGSSAVGGSLDMDTDAFFIMLLSFAAFRFGGIGPWVLMPGLLRYIFVFVFQVVRPVPVESKALALFMKIACVAAVILLIAANAAFLPRLLRLVCAFAAAGIVTISFFWETAYYGARRKS